MSAATLWGRCTENKGIRPTMLGLVGILLMAVMSYLYVVPPSSACAQTALTDFCYQFSFRVTNNTGSTITNQLIRVPVPVAALRAQNYIDAHGLGAREVSDTPLMLQDFAPPVPSTGYWWVLASTIENGATEQFSVRLGTEKITRDNPFVMGGSDAVTKAHEAAMNQTDNVRITAIAESAIEHGSPGWFLSHHDGSSGYRLGTVKVGADTKIRAQIDDKTLDVDWTGDLTTVTMEFQNPNLTIALDGIPTASLNTGLAAIGTNSESLTAGEGYSGALNYVRLDKSITTTPEVLLLWGFDAVTTVETDDTNPFGGTTPDASASGWTGTYSIDSDQSGISVVTLPITDLFADPSISVGNRLFESFLGTPSATDFNATPWNLESTLPGSTDIKAIAAQAGVSNQAIWYMIASVLALFAMVIGGLLTRNALIALAVAAGVLVTFVILGVVSPWVPLLYSLVSVGFWGILRQARMA